MIHPDTRIQYVNDTVGYGVFATAVLPIGTLVYVQDPLDIIIPPDSEWLKDPFIRKAIDKYSTIEPPDGARHLSWDLAKHVNHCCHANLLSTGYGFEIAVSDIEPGEELRDDYAMFNLRWDIPLSDCHANCRGWIKAVDLARQVEIWDTQIKTALQRVLLVAQPLWPLLDIKTKGDLHSTIKNGTPYRSVSGLMIS